MADFLTEVGEGGANEEGSNSKSTSQEKSGIVLLAGAHKLNDKKTDPGLALDAPHVLPDIDDAVKCYSSSSSSFFLILRKNGELLGCGSNTSGQLGLGNAESQWLPVKVPLDKIVPKIDVKQVSTGKAHTLVLSTTGKLYATGSNMAGASFGGQLGIPSQKVETHNFRIVEGFNSPVRDIAAGHFHSLCCLDDGKVYSWGHPEYGTLGHGTTGVYIREGGKGAKEVYDCVDRPMQITKFVKKDGKNQRVTQEYSADDIKVRCVAAGRSHSVVVEDWESGKGYNRVFTFGMGAYGRLGHAWSHDELFPRELVSFSEYDRDTGVYSMPMRTRAVRKVVCSQTVTLAVVESGGLYHWGKMANAARGEATMYPTFMNDMATMEVNPERVCSGSTNIVGFTDCAVAWGVGKVGYEGEGKSSITPKYLVEDIKEVLSTASGEGPQVMVTVSKRSDFPAFNFEAPAAVDGDGAGPPAKKSKKK
jgi:alpha-tubulin suppressor-like RCC1 family protein